MRYGWVEAPHARIYWEASGNRDGVPVIYLHGGPGSSLGKGGYRLRHDPEKFWIIGIDQRGCGRSMPRAQDDLEHLDLNTTWNLINDIELVRKHLGIDAWILTGISWGSTLALAYALEHPERVLGIALMAVTTTRREEVDWITQGVGMMYPEAWQEFSDAAQALPGERVVEAYSRRLAGSNRADAALAADAWDRWESWHISMGTDRGAGPMIADERDRMTFALLVTRYWAGDGFLTHDAQILSRAQELEGIPGHLIHGRRDVSGPVVTPWLLHRAWPGSSLTVVESEGHGGPISVAALTAAVEEIRTFIEE